MAQNSLPDDYVPLNGEIPSASAPSSVATAQLPEDYVPLTPSASEGGDTASVSRSPNTMDYVLPTGLSTLLQGSPAQFGKGLNSTNMWGDLNRPAQGVRQAILSAAGGKNPISGFQQGYTNPEQTSQTGIQDALLKTAPQTRSVLANFIGGLPASTAGVLGDTAVGLANPANALASLLAPGVARSAVGKFSPDQFVLNKSKTLVDHLLGQDIQSKYIPEMEAIYQNRVDSFTPHVQELASKTLGVPQEIVDHIAQRTPQVVTASANGVGNNPGAIQNVLETGMAKRAQDVSDAYDKAWSAVPKNAFIALPKTQAATTKFLTENKIIDNVGNLTEYGKQALGDDVSLNKVYQNHLLMGGDSGAASTAASRANVAPVNQPQWTLLRNNFNRARNSANYSSPITGLLDNLHADAMDAGVNIQPARELAAQNFEFQDMAKPYLTATGENKFSNVFGLKDKQINDLEAVGKYIGQPLVQQAKDVQAADILANKIRRYGTSYVGSPSAINNSVEKVGSVSPFPSAWVEKSKAEHSLREILGKGKDVKSLLSSLNNRKLIIGSGVGYGIYKLKNRLGIGGGGE